MLHARNFQFGAPMSYHELPRRELQMICKEYGLPANKSNAVMASSITSFLGNPRTNVLYRAPQVLPAAYKSMKARALPKTHCLDTSLASLILKVTGSRNEILKSNPRKLGSQGRKPLIAAGSSAFTASPPEKHVGSIPQAKTAPLLRRKNSDVTHSTVVSADPTENLSLLHEISMETSGTVVEKLNTPQPELVPVHDAAVMSTCNEGPIELEPIALHAQGCQNKNTRWREQRVQTSLIRPLIFQITANVDKLINRATMMLRIFDEWKDIDELATTLETH